MTAVALEPLKVVTITDSVSSVMLHVSENQKNCVRPMEFAAIAQERQLLFADNVPV